MDVPVKRSDFDFIELVVDCVDEKFPRPEYSCIAFEFLEE
jgi:L-ribulose-5-phosphate 3-epimerase UlaE